MRSSGFRLGRGIRFTEAHHVKHWADGGETSLRNTLLLCRRRHRAVDGLVLSNGAALYRDSEIPWEIEAAREAADESLG